jgi:hypothetical protein
MEAMQKNKSPGVRDEYVGAFGCITDCVYSCVGICTTPR